MLGGNAQALDEFLRSVQTRAYCHAQYATQNREDALDIVQEAMMTLAKSYSHKDAEEWPPLFHRILQNKITDFFRKRKVRQLFWASTSNDSEAIEVEAPAPDHDSSPDKLLEGLQTNKMLVSQIRALPTKQQQTFLLRVWWGYDTKEVADIMQCTEGTVKTHLSRATEKLKCHSELKEAIDRESSIR